MNALNLCNACDFREVQTPNDMGLCEECLRLATPSSEEPEERLDLWAELGFLFSQSGYLHSPGAGDLEAIERVIERAGDLWEDPDGVLAMIAGAIAARSLCDLDQAVDLAMRIIVDREEAYLDA